MIFNVGKSFFMDPNNKKKQNLMYLIRSNKYLQKLYDIQNGKKNQEECDAFFSDKKNAQNTSYIYIYIYDFILTMFFERYS